MAIGAVITADEVKELNSISGSTDYDYQITALIPIVSEFVWKYCNFGVALTEVATYDFPVGLKLPAAQMIYWQIKNQEHGISQEKVGNYTVSFTDSMPKAILHGLKPYIKTRYV